MAEALKRAVRRYADAHANPDGLATTPIQGVTMMRVQAPTGMTQTIYKPLLCLVLAGAKQVSVGNESHEFAAGRSVLASVDVPVVGRVVRASRDEPYLALALELDMSVMREVMAQIGDEDAGTPERLPRPDPALFVDDTDEAVVDGALRLVRLLDRPEAISVLRAPIVKELHYWLLAGRHGAAIRRLARQDGRAERVARAVAILRAGFAELIPVERLAAAAGMSPSSFHQHFKAVTSLSPLQFQKQLRLLEARRLMVDGGFGATRAAFAVGYESASQFTREYGRMFGAPPRRDAGRSQAAA